MKKPLLLIMAFSVTSCTVPEPVQKAVESAKRVIGMAFQTTPAPTPTPTQTVSQEKAFKANAELLAEMIQIVFNLPAVEDQEQYRALLSSLNQGASLEGLYRGLVMSSRYRLVESKAKASSPLALKFFALEMAKLQISMRNPTRFTKDSAKDFPNIEFPEDGNAPVADADENEVTSTPTDQKEIAESLLTSFIGATPFTLKRVLAEEALKKIDELSESSGDLAQWYAPMTVSLQDSKVDFGLPLRNSTDFDFHFRFAKSASVDRVKWEVLNRYLRIFNTLN